MQKGLEAFIKEKKQKEFEADVKELQEAFERFKAKYPSADWYVQVEQEGVLWRTWPVWLMDFTEIEP